MTYTIIQPPFPLEFRNRSKRELEAYRIWFHQIAPGRIDELTRAVNSTPGYEHWESNATLESLEPLGQWFEHQVETRQRTVEEIEEIRARLVFPIDISSEELTDRTFSLAMDIGMYFGQTVLRNLPGTRWDQPLKPKNFVDYGQPVLMGFGSVSLNPVRVMVTTAYGISHGKPANLRELYDVWAKMRQ